MIQISAWAYGMLLGAAACCALIIVVQNWESLGALDRGCQRVGSYNTATPVTGDVTIFGHAWVCASQREK